MKFKLTSEYIEKYGRKAFKIEATCDFDLPFPFGKVKKGDKGGYVEKEEFLSQTNKGWAFENSEIWGGVIYDGVIRGGEIWGGEIWGGVIYDGEIWGGVIRGGEIWGGVIWGGVIWGGEDIFFIGHVGSKKRILTATRQKDGSYLIYRGCFKGSLEDFKSSVVKKYKDTDAGTLYLKIADIIDFHFSVLHPYKERN